MRLTQDVKDQIQKRLLEATFNKEQEALTAAENTLAVKVLESMLDRKTRDALRKAPEQFVRRDSSIDVDIPGRRWTRLDYKDTDLSPQHSAIVSDELAKEVGAHLDRLDELNARRTAALHQLRGVFLSVTTTKRLVEVWPDLEPYIPFDTEVVYPIAVRPAELNAAFGLPV